MSENNADAELYEEPDDLVPLIRSQAEDEGDVAVDDDTTFSASISAKDWTVETLVSQMRKGRIDLDPAFQRRNAWLDNRKSKLIESILLGYPIPQIVLAEKRDRPGHYFVLDGKQRLLALRQFFADPGDSRDESFETFKLERLEILRDLKAQTAHSLEEQHAEHYAALENHSIRTVVLSKWNSERLLLSLFLRLNTGSVQLSPQELRQALIPGEFISWLDLTSGSMTPLLELLGNTHPDRRMVDAELLLRYLAFKNSPLDYSGNLKQFLDRTCELWNDSWGTYEAEIAGEASALSKALAVTQELFGNEHACRKWSGRRYERAINRAVFDVLTYSLSHSEVAEAARAQPGVLEDAFKELCSTDNSFQAAITSTTKTRDAFLTRHAAWQKKLQASLSVGYPLPKPLLRVP